MIPNFYKIKRREKEKWKHPKKIFGFGSLKIIYYTGLYKKILFKNVLSFKCC